MEYETKPTPIVRLRNHVGYSPIRRQVMNELSSVASSLKLEEQRTGVKQKKAKMTEKKHTKHT